MPPESTPLIIALIVVLGAASAFFSASETALFALRGPQIEAVKARRPRDRALIAGFLAKPRRLLSLLVLADVLANIPLCLLSLLLLEERVPALFSREVPRWAAAPILFAVVIGLCDLLPKLLALRRPESVAGPAVGALRWITPLLGPLADALDRLAERLANILTPASLKGGVPLTGDEIETMALLAAESGILRGSEGPIIGELLKLGAKSAKDVMTPRVDSFGLPDDLSRDEAARRVRRGGHRWVPVYGETPDDILGVLDARQFLMRSDDEPYVERLLPPSYVPETMPALSLLNSFLTHRQSIALVVDEYGGYEGIVTPSDLIEEILGDAMPGGESGPEIDQAEDGSFIASGQARLDDLAERLGIPLEREGLDTVGGLVINQLGQIPRAGAELALPGGYRLRVQRASRHRVELVRIEREEELP